MTEKIYLVHESWTMLNEDIPAEHNIIGVFSTFEKAMESYKAAKQSIENDWCVDRESDTFTDDWEEEEEISETCAVYSLSDTDYNNAYSLCCECLEVQ